MADVKRMSWQETRDALIRHGVPASRLPEEWQPGIDLRGLNLANAQLQGAYLTKVRLAGTKLAGANLLDADLSGANFVS